MRNQFGEKTYWKVEKYFLEGVYDQRIPVDAEEKVVYYHRTITSYVKAIHQAGFAINAMLEPKPSEDMLMKYPEFEEDLNVSCFLVFKLRKLS
ncbi:hypothetical protein [Ornithinibacillus contaminans]|uniref:hypothetical protein n=1 Tax=Ornithinibacillus contaminans TaxID=694055 RepID=UPI00069DBB8F|nr:hypothetical protein [Ornithinibacillus contaminans]